MKSQTKLLTTILVFFFLSVYSFEDASSNQGNKLPRGGAKNVTSMKFLVTVNDTWDPNGCIATVLTQPLKPNIHHKSGEAIDVGGCDHGPLDYSVRDGSDSGTSKMTVNVIFYSSVIEDASHPSCDIEWNGTYRVPQNIGDQRPGYPQESLLPGCFVMDSREGYHMTYYWFYLLDWTFA